MKNILLVCAAGMSTSLLNNIYSLLNKKPINRLLSKYLFIGFLSFIGHSLYRKDMGWIYCSLGNPFL